MSRPVWCGVFRYVMLCFMYHGKVWYGMVWCGVAWYGMVWHGMVWFGMVWCGTVWCVQTFVRDLFLTKLRLQWRWKTHKKGVTASVFSLALRCTALHPPPYLTTPCSGDLLFDLIFLHSSTRGGRVRCRRLYCHVSCLVSYLTVSASTAAARTRDLKRSNLRLIDVLVAPSVCT